MTEIQKNPFLIVAIGVFLQYIRYLLLSGLFYGYFYKLKKEKYLPQKIISTPFKKEELRRDLKMAWGFCFGVIFVFSFLVYDSTKIHFKLYTNIADYPLYWLPFSFLGLIFGIDLYYYFCHRILHQRWIFKWIHSWHHKANDPSPFTSFALHPIEAGLLALFNLTFIYFFPTHLGVFAAATLVGGILNNNGHLGVESIPESLQNKPFIRWINSARYHTLHHQLPTKNFGLYFIFWDKLFGTLRNPTPSPLLKAHPSQE